MHEGGAYGELAGVRDNWWRLHEGGVGSCVDLVASPWRRDQGSLQEAIQLLFYDSQLAIHVLSYEHCQP